MKTTILSFSILLLFACGAQPGNENSDNEGIGETAEASVPEITDRNPDNDPRALEDLIRVAAPAANAVISSPLKISGDARGSWFFEGEFPIALYAAGGEVLAEGFGHSSEPWMTEQFIPFTAELTFDAPSGTRLQLELMLNNPADDEGFDRSVIIPVVIE